MSVFDFLRVTLILKVNRGGIYLPQDGVHLSHPKDWLLVMRLCS